MFMVLTPLLEFLQEHEPIDQCYLPWPPSAHWQEEHQHSEQPKD